MQPAFLGKATYKKKTPALLHGVFRRGENAPSRQMLLFAYITLTENLS
jgi:hypothetical protein